jgi:ferric-dicitrate binding protein FerR (iron transport regulator)
VKVFRLKFATRRRRRLIGCAIVVAAALGMAYYVGAPHSTIATELNERKTKRLDDGSIVRLEGSTTVRVKFSETHRDLSLLEGTARFEVAEDRRPFRVMTHLADITAVATKFGVTVDTAAVTVTVDEGVVEVSRRGKAGSVDTTVRAGEPPYTIAATRYAPFASNGVAGLKSNSHRLHDVLSPAAASFDHWFAELQRDRCRVQVLFGAGSAH